MGSRLEELKKAAEAAEAKAKAVALSTDEQDEAALLARIDAAAEAEAAADKARRGLALRARLDAARAAGKAAKPPYLVIGVDLDEVGAYVVRSPAKDPWDTFMRELEAKKSTHSALYVELGLACALEVGFPDESGALVFVRLDDKTAEGRAAGFKARDLLEANPAAATQLGNEISDLGKLRAKEAKRGR